MLSVVCLKWRDPKWQKEYERPRFFRYGAKHVNALQRMLQRHLGLPFKLFCFTDDLYLIRPEIVCLPLPEREIGKADRFTYKLWLFGEHMREILGDRFLFLDLDCVILRDIGGLVDRPEDFVIWRGRRTAYNTSMFVMDTGARAHLWERFDPADWRDVGPERRRRGAVQTWLDDEMSPDEAVWTADDGVHQYKADCALTALPSTRIVFFNGNFDPSLARHSWVREAWR